MDTSLSVRTLAIKNFNRQSFGESNGSYRGAYADVVSFCWQDNHSILLGVDTNMGTPLKMRKAAVWSLDINTHKLSPWLVKPGFGVTEIVPSFSSKWIAVVSYRSAAKRNDLNLAPSVIDIFEPSGRHIRTVDIGKTVDICELSNDGRYALIIIPKQDSKLSTVGYEGDGYILDTKTGKLMLIGNNIADLAWVKNSPVP